MLFPSNRIISIASQPEGFSYGISLANYSPTGSLRFGFSGQSGNLFGFTLVSGKVFDHNSDFVFSWDETRTISVSGNVGVKSPAAQSFFINGVPIKTQQVLTAVGQIDSFYVYPSGFIPDLSYSINGQSPTYETSPVVFSQFNKTGTGYIINTDPNQYFRFYSGLSNDTDFTYISGFTGALQPGQSGALIYRKNYEPTDAADYTNSVFPLDTLLYTNFGTEDLDISGQNVFPISQNLSTQFQQSISGSGVFNNFLNWENLVGEGTYFDAAIPISISLRRLSGTGVFSGIYSLETGLNTFPYAYVPMVYNAGITGYSGVINSIGISGLAIGLRRLTTDNGTQVMRFDIAGLSTGISINITGV